MCVGGRGASAPSLAPVFSCLLACHTSHSYSTEQNMNTFSPHSELLLLCFQANRSFNNEGVLYARPWGWDRAWASFHSRSVENPTIQLAAQSGHLGRILPLYLFRSSSTQLPYPSSIQFPVAYSFLSIPKDAGSDSSQTGFPVSSLTLSTDARTFLDTYLSVQASPLLKIS